MTESKEPSSEDALESLLETKGPEPTPPDQGKLAKLDPLRKYLLEISKFEPLTQEEETRLAVLYREQGDEQGFHGYDARWRAGKLVGFAGKSNARGVFGFK